MIDRYIISWKNDEYPEEICMNNTVLSEIER